MLSKPIHYRFNTKFVTEELIKWITNWFEGNGKDCNAVLGMSGGKDSTICAALLAKALGPDRVIGVIMPDVNQSYNEADEICDYLGIHTIYAPIEIVTASIHTALSSISRQAEQNIPPRVRMTMLYAISQSMNGRVINTCNLSENIIGYETIFGDAAGDMSPLGNLTVSEVKQIGKYLELPDKWVDKIPDDGLPNSSPDEEKIGFTYAELDKWIREGEHDIKPESLEKMKDMYYNSSFKRMPMATYNNCALRVTCI